MAHKHFCFDCEAVIAEGEFDCELDSDHDFELCAACAARHVELDSQAGHAALGL